MKTAINSTFSLPIIFIKRFGKFFFSKIKKIFSEKKIISSSIKKLFSHTSLHNQFNFLSYTRNFLSLNHSYNRDAIILNQKVNSKCLTMLMGNICMKGGQKNGLV